jgi:hypothetical protein
MMKKVCGWVVAGLALTSVASCGGGSVQLDPSFVAVHNTMAAMGLSQSGEISEGSLPEGGVARLTTPLRGGDCYTVVAFGSDGVQDIDVVVMDDAGTEVATDRTTDQQAAAQLCPDADGEYQIAVRMTRGSGGYVVTTWSGMPRGGGTAVAGGSGRGTCATPLPLQVGQAVRGSTAQGQSSMTGSCIRGGEAPEMVYALTVERRAQVAVTITSDYDGALYLLGACGEMRTEIACNDDDPSTSRSHVEATLDPGTYFVVVDGYGAESGQYELLAEVSQLQSPTQVCAAATPLVSGQAVTGSTAGQPSYFTATCAGGAGSPDRVYSLAVPTRSRMRVRMQSTYDGAIYLRRQCEDPNSELACNDDYGDTRHSMLMATVDPGTYFVYADGFSTGNAGDYSMRADLVPLNGPPVAADNCGAAGVLAPGRDLDVDTFAAHDDLAGSCGGQGAPDVVYRLDVQSRMRLRARVANGEFPAALYLQRTCGQANTEVVCASGAAPAAPVPGGQPPPVTELDANLTPGTYFLVVDGTAPDAIGAARVEVRLDDLQALERACQQAPRIRPGRAITGDTGSSSDRFQATCADGAQSNDVVYRLQIDRRSRVRITSEQQYDGAIYIRRDCADMSTEVACNDDTGDNRHSTVETELDRGTYFVFVDGFGNSSQGSYTLDVDVSRP